MPNAYRLDARVISGGRPDGEAGFRALQELGVRTVISVDGAKPDVSLAKECGLRYVHLPHGYDGISDQRVLELAKAISDLPGPIYIHCHHGKHRSPAAAVVACIGAGLLSPDDGLEFLRLAGTSQDYQGLYQVVANAKRKVGLDRLEVKYQEVVDVPPLAAAMVQIERTFDNLKIMAKAGWKTPPSLPDLTPQHEALLLREHFTELLRTDEVSARPIAFREILKHSVAAVESIEQHLSAESAAPPVDSVRGRLSDTLAVINNDCQRCHREHRD